MKKQSKSFAELLRSNGDRYPLRAFFDDFLTVTICCFSRGPGNDQAYNHQAYLKVIEKYDNDQELFTSILAQLLLETEERRGSQNGNDVLGEFFFKEFLLSHYDKRFTPWYMNELMAEFHEIACPNVESKRIKIMDTACGSGRALLSHAKTIGQYHCFYGIDEDLTCVKMTAINMFLNRMFRGEVMLQDPKDTDDFKISYRTSISPLGIFPIHKKEESQLWNYQQILFRKRSESKGEGNG